MPSFDLVSKVDLQTLDNAVNTVEKEIKNRYDFKGNHVVIDLNKKDMNLEIRLVHLTELESKLAICEQEKSKLKSYLENRLLG